MDIPFLNNGILEEKVLPEFNNASYAGYNTFSVKNEAVITKTCDNENFKEHSNENTDSPCYYLNLFLNGGIIQWLLKLVNENTEYSKNDTVTEDELRCFVAIVYLTGYVEVPRRRLFWERSPDCHNSLVSNAIQRDKFEYIFKKLCSINVTDGINFQISDFNKVFKDILKRYCPVDNYFNIGQVDNCINKNFKMWCGTDKYGYCNFCSVFEKNSAHGIITQYIRILKDFNAPELELAFDDKFVTPQLLHDLKGMNVKHNAAQLVKGRSFRFSNLIGIDKLISGLSLYKSKLRGKRGFLQYVVVYLDIILHNAYHLYKYKRKQDAKQLDTLNFRRNIVIYLLERHRKVSVNRKVLRTARHCKKSVFCESRYDSFRHYVTPQEKQTRCGSCSKKTTTRCQKCNVGVHVKCFIDFHTRPK